MPTAGLHADGEPARARERPAASWSSIERQLPLLILVLLVPTVAILVVWAHALVRADLEDSALVRLRASATEMQAILGQTVGMRTASASNLARRSQMVALARAAPSEREQALAAAREQVLPLLQRNAPQVCEVWSTTGELLLREESAPPAGGEPATALSAYRGPVPTRLGVQPIRVHAGQPFFDVVGRLHEPQAEGEPEVPTLGFVVLRRELRDRRGAEQLARLIGRKATVFVGNCGGSVWTDLEREVARPAGDGASGRGAFHERADGVLRVGAGAPIESSPWAVWVEGDAAHLLAPARNLAVALTAIGALLLLGGGAGALWISRRVTRPLRDATRAAEAIAAGHYDRRLVVQRHDEVGRLTQAFNTMAEHVERSRGELEQRVAARTADLRQAVAQLREAQDDLVRQEKLALLGQLAGSVGHELRNPLAVMSNTVSWLETVLGDVPADVRERLGVLRRQISLSEKITTDLLDFTRKRQTHAAAVPLEQVAQEQLARLGPVGFVVERDFACRIDPARVDAVHAGQVVFNLLTNASQAIAQQPNGRVTVRTRQHGDRVRLEVEDNGPGVPESLRAKIFEPLFTTRALGIGLGLAVSRRLSEDNGGELWHEVPDTGRGARFVFVLPALPLVQA